MQPGKLIRDPDRVNATFKELPDKRLITLKGCKIYVPTRWEERGLAEVGIDTYICGICAIVVDDLYYVVSLVNANWRIEPTSTLKIDIDGDEYYEFTFEPGSTVIATTMLVRIDTLVYKIFDEILSKGRVPFYLGYKELGKLFDTAKTHAGANIGLEHEVTELLVSMVARDPKDRHRYYRQTVKTAEDLKKVLPVIIGLRVVPYAATNTTNRIAGSYFDDGLTSALVEPTDRVERIEEILRK